jgi:alpha-1,3-glucosyltransferase
LQDRCLEAAFLFAVLLNLKHIFIYIAPAYFVYLLKHYCFAAQTEGSTHTPKMKDFLLKNFVKLGAIVVAVFLFSFGPFIYMVSTLDKEFFKVDLMASFTMCNLYKL